VSEKEFHIRELDLSIPPTIKQGLPVEEASEIARQNNLQYFSDETAKEIIKNCRPGMM
jgi:hypothetical protein